MGTRRSDFAGSWYPAREADCRKTIEGFVKDTAPCTSPQETRVGGIVPHAGWFFSGRIACNVFKCLSEARPPDLILLFGRHLHPGSGNYIMKEGKWATPLGELEVDRELGERLASEFPFIVETDARYDQDNTIELQLPFIRYFFPEAKILPVGVPPALSSIRVGERAAEVAEGLGRKTMIIGSTDLTHYGYNYGFTPRGVGKEAVRWVKDENDKRLVDLILGMDPAAVIQEALTNQNACCAGAVAAAISASRKLGARKGERLVYSSSYDIRPDSSFVGYVGVIFS